MTLIPLLSLISTAVGRNSPSEDARNEKLVFQCQCLLFSVASALVTGLTHAQSCRTGRCQQHSGISHTLLGGQHMDQDSNLQAAKMKLLKKNQVGDDPLYHPVEISFNDFKYSSDSSSFSKNCPFFFFYSKSKE